MGTVTDIITIARWEVKRSFSMMMRDILPLSIVLFIVLLLVTGFAAQSGMHLQDGMYDVGVDDPQIARVLAGDTRFSVFEMDSVTLLRNRNTFDLIIVQGQVYTNPSERGKAAEKTLGRDYAKYTTVVYNSQEDLFAAYPLWIDIQSVRSELDFAATENGQYITAVPESAPPVPQREVKHIPTPSPTLAFSREQLREELVKSSAKNSQISRYTEALSSGTTTGNFKTPSQLSPPLPFDSIIFVFVFIFPLYFVSQFFMMSVMNERIGRKGEVLLSAPLKPSSIIFGKMLPYFIGMCVISAGIIMYLKASPLIILPLIPIISFYLSCALLIGMISRSFKELSFISIFFSTVITAYLFIPSVFANVHVISLVSPLTLIVLTLQNTAWTVTDYLFSTSLFWLTGAVIFYIAIKNFKDERLFSEKRLMPRLREFLAETLSWKHPFLSLFLLAACSVPFVFMVQLLSLVLFFNLPMPYSLVFLLVTAAFIEELAKAAGIYTFFVHEPSFLAWKHLAIACAATAIGFLAGEKLLLFVMLTQITESVFGSVLFLSLGVLWMPLLLHFTGVLIVASSLRYWGRRGLVPGLVAATAIHCLYNLSFILRWI